MRCALPFVVALVSCVLLTGCFGSSTSPSPDSGLEFDSPSGLDSGAAPETSSETGPPHDGGTLDATDAAHEAGNAAGTFSTAPVDFGLANCGGQPSPASQTYTFQNTGPVAITWSASVGSSVFAIQGASSGTVAPGASGSITVGVTTIPATSTAGTPIQDTLTITTNVPGSTTVAVPLSVTPQGGSLTLTGPGGFGSVTVGKPVTQSFALQNVGNASVSVTLGSSTNPLFTVTYTGAPGPASIAAGQSLAGGSATFTPTAAGAQSGSAAIQVTGVLCASPATSIALSGTGTTSPLSIGPSPLDFSTVTCGKTAPAQTVTLQNANGLAIPFTASLGQGASSPYTIDAPTGTVPPNGSAVIHVTPNPVPAAANLTPGFYDDTLTVTGQGLTPVVIPLQESAGGAVLAITMANTHFGTVTNTTATLPFTVTNSGNQDASLHLNVSGSTNFSALLTTTTTATANGGTAPGNVSFTPTINGAASGSLSVSAPNLCAPPASIAFDAVGQIPIASFPKGQGPFAVAITCGGAGSSASFAVHNGGNAPLSIVNPISVNGDFSISGFTSPIAPGGTDTVTVTAVVGSAGGSATPYADTLRFSTNEVGGPTYTIPVNVTVTGINLVLSPSSFSFTDCATNLPFSIVVTGSLPAGVPATVAGNASYCAFGSCGESVGFRGGFPQGAPVSVSPGNSYPDAIFSDENSGCTPLVNASFFTVTGPVCQQSLGISATFSGNGCNLCGSYHG
jgi:hypothetical protein